MKIALITDIHFGARNDSPLFLNNLTKFFDKVFFPTLEQEKITTVLILGDTWQNRRAINILTLRIAREKFFKVLESRNISVKTIYGNHDVFYRNTNDINSIDFLESAFQNMEVVKVGKIFDFDGLKVGMMSWIPNDNPEEHLKFLHESVCDVLCGHFEINAFEMTAGHFCTGGLEASVFRRYDKVLSGHFHIPSTDGRITYLGNTNQTNWGDYGVEKGAWILDTATLKLNRILNPFTIYDRIHYSEDIDLLKFDYNQYSGKIVRLFVANLLEVDKKKYGLFIDRLSDTVHELEVVETTSYNSEESESSHIEVCTNTVDILKSYVDSVPFNNLESKDKFQTMILDVYQEAFDKVKI